MRGLLRAESGHEDRTACLTAVWRPEWWGGTAASYAMPMLQIGGDAADTAPMA
jgi:hypothetical protein